jgi:hypothetical protein
MCNAYNHPFDCDCGFGGDTGGGGRRGWYQHVSVAEVLERPVSAGWAKDSRSTVESYVNPNAHCPVCGAAVYFYRSPYDGRVFFDELGWPWPKHPCIDNGRDPMRVTRGSIASATPRADPAWRAEGWHSLLASKVYSAGDRLQITGDLGEQFRELYLPTGEALDAQSPILVRAQDGKPDIFEMTFLRSDRFGVRDRKTIGFGKRLGPLGEETILRAASDDFAANHTIGSYVLWQLDDPVGARPYLKRAVAGGIADALFDLAIIELFSKRTLASA